LKKTEDIALNLDFQAEIGQIYLSCMINLFFWIETIFPIIAGLAICPILAAGDSKEGE